tara:strand:- start:508 stop:846 length:339 start_codon:yes stop_codon:yes gene_type:complete
MRSINTLAFVAMTSILGVQPLAAAEISATIVGAGYVESRQNLEVKNTETKDTNISQESSLVSIEAQGDSKIGGTIVAAGYVDSEQEMLVSGGKHDGSSISQTATAVRVIARD